MRKKIVSSVLIYLLIVITTVWLIGFVGFCIYAFSFKFQAAERSDGIVVLTGGGDRIGTALDLLRDGYADYLLISGVNPSVQLKDLTRGLPDAVRSRITLDYRAQDTRGNAHETAYWVRSEKIKSILLITSFYHMPRSVFEVLKVIPDLKIIPYPVFPKSFNDSVDWIRTRYAWLLFVEYHKFLATRFQQFIKRIIL